MKKLSISPLVCYPIKSRTHMHSCTQSYTHMHTCTHTLSHMHTRSYTCTRTHTHEHACAHAQMCSCTHSYTPAHTDTLIHTHTNTHVRTHICSCTHTLTHTHTYNFRPGAIPVSDGSGSGTALCGENVLDVALICCCVTLCFVCHVISRYVVRPLVVRRGVYSPGHF